jgi:hypothetical protein
MMLGLGVGGWAAGLLHLVTHAFFKALLFLGSGSVIYGCHHQQDMRKMGGLYPKMKITALTMDSPVQRLVQQGRHPRPGVRLREVAQAPCLAVHLALAHGGLDHVLHVPHVVHDLRRRTEG